MGAWVRHFWCPYEVALQNLSELCFWLSVTLYIYQKHGSFCPYFSQNCDSDLFLLVILLSWIRGWWGFLWMSCSEWSTKPGPDAGRACFLICIYKFCLIGAIICSRKDNCTHSLAEMGYPEGLGFVILVCALTAQKCIVVCYCLIG